MEDGRSGSWPKDKSGLHVWQAIVNLLCFVHIFMTHPAVHFFMRSASGWSSKITDDDIIFERITISPGGSCKTPFFIFLLLKSKVRMELNVSTAVFWLILVADDSNLLLLLYSFAFAHQPIGINSMAQSSTHIKPSFNRWTHAASPPLHRTGFPRGEAFDRTDTPLCLTETMRSRRLSAI